MTIYRFRVWLLPNSPLEFEPETEVWRDIKVDGSHTLIDFHEAIFDAFERRDTHAYDFLLRNEHGIAIRSYTHPQRYSGDQSWPPMDDEEIDRFLDHAIPDDAPEEAVDKFRDLRKNPPEEGMPPKPPSTISISTSHSHCSTSSTSATVGNIISNQKQSERGRSTAIQLWSTRRATPRRSILNEKSE